MSILTRWEPTRGLTTLQDQINRLFSDSLDRTGEEGSLTAWAPAVDIYETEHELVVRADLPDIDPKDLDIRVENNILTIRGERKFEKKVNEDNYLRVERAYGTFSRSFFDMSEPYLNSESGANSTGAMSAMYSFRTSTSRMSRHESRTSRISTIV